MPQPTRLVALISGGGRTLMNIHERILAGTLEARIEGVISSRPGTMGVERAGEAGLDLEVITRKSYHSADAFSEAIWQKVDTINADLVCMAGFLSLLKIPESYLGRVMNIHPSLLPKYGGQGMWGHHVHDAVLAAGDSESGCTVHLADNEYDRGPIICQRRCQVNPGDDADALAARVFVQECEAYPQAIQMFQRGELDELRAKVVGR
jgi:phosphoribosylglycinamide formyltransferase-1